MPFLRIAELERREPIPGFHLRFLHSDSMTVAFWDIDRGAVMPEHSHPHEQVAIVVEGEFELVVAGESHIVRAGEVAAIASGAPHSGRALSRCRIYDVFHPRRDDFDSTGEGEAGSRGRSGAGERATGGSLGA